MDEKKNLKTRINDIIDNHPLGVLMGGLATIVILSGLYLYPKYKNLPDPVYKDLNGDGVKDMILTSITGKETAFYGVKSPDGKHVQYVPKDYFDFKKIAPNRSQRK